VINIDVHRKLGSVTNNRSWNLIESAELTPEEAEELLVTAMASVYHWTEVGDLEKFPARDLVAAAALLKLGLTTVSEGFVKRAFEALSQPDRAEWEQAFAFAIHAWYAGLIGDTESANRHYERAKEIGEGMPDPEDRMIFFNTFDIIPNPAAA
jgi:Tfp pilus assembly protein PilF